MASGKGLTVTNHRLIARCVIHARVPHREPSRPRKGGSGGGGGYCLLLLCGREQTNDNRRKLGGKAVGAYHPVHIILARCEPHRIPQVPPPPPASNILYYTRASWTNRQNNLEILVEIKTRCYVAAYVLYPTGSFIFVSSSGGWVSMKLKFTALPRMCWAPKVTRFAEPTVLCRSNETSPASAAARLRPSSASAAARLSRARDSSIWSSKPRQRDSASRSSERTRRHSSCSSSKMKVAAAVAAAETGTNLM